MSSLQDITRFGRPQIPGKVTTRPDGQLVTTFPLPQNNNSFLVRTDYNAGKHTIDARYNYNKAFQRDSAGNVPTYLPLDRTARILTDEAEAALLPGVRRESDPARSFYCRPVSIDDRPTIWTSQVDVGYIQQYIDPADRFPAAIGDLATPWDVDLAHQPSLAYVPYLLTGDPKVAAQGKIVDRLRSRRSF